MHDFQSDLDAAARIDAVPTILEIVCRTTGMGFATVARVTRERWIACGVRDDIALGLRPGSELKIETTLCNNVRDTHQAVVIDNVAQDANFSNHPIPAMYGFQSYISMPIILPGGQFFGTLCAIDPRPHRVSAPEVVGMFRMFAELIAFHLDAHRRLAASEARLLSEREGAELREQFIAVLGHDLRNPLAAIDAGARLLLRTPLNERALAVVGQMQSSVTRMSGLITNVLDFARGRLGGGFVLERRADVRLEPMLDLVIAELRAASDRAIACDFTGLRPIACDSNRIGQMVSNLVGNAVLHGTPGTPVRVCASCHDGAFELSVCNAGGPLPDTTVAHLFQPFFRADTRPNQQGLGLGLYIASQIARAHGGTLAADSRNGEVHFVFRMPLA